MRELSTLLFSTFIALGIGCGSGGGDDGGGGEGGGGGGNDTCQPFDETVTDAVEAWNDSTDTAPTTFDSASCTTPNPTTDFCPFEGQAIDFQEDQFETWLAAVTVKVFVDNTVSDPEVVCEAADSANTDADCYQMDADLDGRVTFPHIRCEEPFAIWTNVAGSFSNTRRTLQFDQITKVGGGIQDVLSVSQQTYELVPGIVGFAQDPTLGVVAGKARDCSDNGVRFVTAHITDSHAATAPDSFCGTDTIDRVGTFYFVDETPSPDVNATSEDGLWGFANVPPGPITVYGFSNDGGTKTQVGATQITAFANTIAVVDLFITP